MIWYIWFVFSISAYVTVDSLNYSTTQMPWNFNQKKTNLLTILEMKTRSLVVETAELNFILASANTPVVAPSQYDAVPGYDKQMFKLNAEHQRAHRVPDSLFLPRDVRELNGRFKRRLRHFYFCTDITSERGTDVALSCCSERQNKASTGTGNNNHDQTLRLCLKHVCVCVNVCV